MAIYRSNYLKPDFNIPLTKGNIYNAIKESYYGGLVDVYKNHGVNLHYYDINSLYPFSMLKPMPVGEPVFVEGDLNLKNLFGFFYAKIETPNMNVPVLPTKIKNITLCPIGSFEG